MKHLVCFFVVLVVLLTIYQSDSGYQKPNVVDQTKHSFWESIDNHRDSYANQKKQRKCHQKVTPPPGNGDRETVKCNRSSECPESQKYCIKKLGICTNETTSSCIHDEYCEKKGAYPKKICFKNKCSQCRNYTDCKPPTKHSCSDNGTCVEEYIVNCKTDGFCKRQRCIPLKRNCYYKYCKGIGCIECKSSDDCTTTSKKFCKDNICVECMNNSDCGKGKVCDNANECVNETIYNCLTDDGCQKSACRIFTGCRYKYCVKNGKSENKHCIMCKTDAECIDDKNKFCLDGECTMCKTDSDCKKYNKKYCELGEYRNGICVNCRDNDDCKKDQFCSKASDNCVYNPF